MIALECVTVANAMLFKDLRLRALRDSPSAFSATYAEESELTDAEWNARAAQRSGDAVTTYLAMDGKIPCGIAAGFLDKENQTRAHLVSMWVPPNYRRLGVGRQLVEAIIEWARARGARSLELIVTSNNDAAKEFYQRLGFAMTGKTAPYRNDAALNDLEMIRSIAS